MDISICPRFCMVKNLGHIDVRGCRSIELSVLILADKKEAEPPSRRDVF